MKKKILIIDCGSNKTKDIISIVAENDCITERWYLFYPTIDFKLKLKNRPEKVCLLKVENDEIQMKDFNESFVKSFDAIIFSGGGLLEGIQDEIKSFFNYLLEIEIPVLGICFGHQIIGLVYGAEIYNLGTKVSGDYKVNFLKQTTIINSSPTLNNSFFAKNHTEAIILPTEFELIANSATCQNEMMQHETKAIYGVQFHPEVSGISGETIIQEFLKIN